MELSDKQEALIMRSMKLLRDHHRERGILPRIDRVLTHQHCPLESI